MLYYFQQWEEEEDLILSDLCRGFNEPRPIPVC